MPILNYGPRSGPNAGPSAHSSLGRSGVPLTEHVAKLHEAPRLRPRSRSASRCYRTCEYAPGICFAQYHRRYAYILGTHHQHHGAGQSVSRSVLQPSPLRRRRRPCSCDPMPKVGFPPGRPARNNAPALLFTASLPGRAVLLLVTACRAHQHGARAIAPMFRTSGAIKATSKDPLAVVCPANAHRGPAWLLG